MEPLLTQWFAQHGAAAQALSRYLFEHPETAYREVLSAQALVAFLQGHGFSAAPVEGMPTAFVATWGAGEPVLGFVAEYDALPGMGQTAEPQCAPLEGPGHGCGHNLLGAAVAAAACAAKHYLEATGTQGTVRVVGTPAEENNPTKNILLEKGCFAGIGAAISFHPDQRNCISERSMMAMDSTEYEFFGAAAHAAGAPERGRSALDAAELTATGVNYLREHVPDHVRMHYVFTDGGRAPNIVPEHAALWMMVRGADRGTVDACAARIHQVAQGAALMTETRMSEHSKGQWYESILSPVLNKVFYEAAQQVPPPHYQAEDWDFSSRLQASLADEGHPVPAMLLRQEVEPLRGTVELEPGSSDLAAVSQRYPTLVVNTACFVAGSLFHHWSAAACSGHRIGQQGMLYGAMILAEGAIRLYASPETVADAIAEHKKLTAQH